MPSSLRSGKIIGTDGYQLPSLENFFTIPRELQAHCLSLACPIVEDLHGNPTAGDRQTAVERKTTTKTLQSLMLSSRALNAIATPILYASVKVDRPSILAELVRTLEGNTWLGKLIKRLHLGPVSQASHQSRLDHLSDNTGFFGLDLRYLATTLKDPDCLPLWCCPRRAWDIIRRSQSPNWRDKALLDALDTAARELDVSLLRPRRSAEGVEIGSDAWLVRVVEAQAALDLYLAQMRRVEDAEGKPVEKWGSHWGALSGPKPTGEAIKYPLLQLERTEYSVTSVAPADPDQPFSITRGDLLFHLARRGSPTDCFDHPFIMAHTGRNMFQIRDNGRFELADGVITGLDSLYERDEVDSIWPIVVDDRKPDAIGLTSTVTGILSLSYRLLTLAPQVQHLHLSDFLQYLACGHNRRRLSLSSLRSLALAPFSGCEDNCLAPTNKDLDLQRLETLHLTGSMLAARKVAIISTLPQLRKVKWYLKTVEGTTASGDPFQT